MIKKSLESIDTIKLWLFLPMALLILFFVQKFYNQQDRISDDVGQIKLEVFSISLNSDNLAKRLTAQEELTKQFFKLQLKAHSTTIDTTNENN